MVVEGIQINMCTMHAKTSNKNNTKKKAFHRQLNLELCHATEIIALNIPQASNQVENNRLGTVKKFKKSKTMRL